MFEAEYSKRFTKEFERFRKYDKETTAKIKILIIDTLAHPTYGLGHPERLRHRKRNWGSRHIDHKNRLVYRIIGNVILFDACYGHYDDH
ncbi:MAG: type II toxin-antitoxin system YoeB family toxin [Puniceicoccales bacterium]|nr:type II toxin-antitoxin system YoeB family toxin [Puniceicoccales bacterium]